MRNKFLVFPVSELFDQIMVQIDHTICKVWTAIKTYRFRVRIYKGVIHQIERQWYKVRNVRIF